MRQERENVSKFVAEKVAEFFGQQNPFKIETEDGFVATLNSGFFKKIVEHPGDPVAILMSGTSESGKSHAGKLLLDRDLAHRIKILRIVRELAEEGVVSSELTREGQIDPNNVLEKLISEKDLKIGKVVLRLAEIIDQSDCRLAVVETIKHPAVIEAFRQSKGISVLSLFVDAELEERIKREAKGKGQDPESVRSSIETKDSEKDGFGNQGTREIADIRILNNGATATYDAFLLQMAKEIGLLTGNTECGEAFFYG